MSDDTETAPLSAFTGKPRVSPHDLNPEDLFAWILEQWIPDADHQISKLREVAQLGYESASALASRSRDCPHRPDSPPATPSGSGAPRDDGAPTVVALRIALADAQTAFSGEDDRHAALGWLLDRLSSLIADSADLMAIREKCRVVYYPPLSDPMGTYPIEHTMAARKDSWDTIIATLRAVRATPHGSEQ